MLTRPLELASRLRPAPRGLAWPFLVNAGLLVLFFSLFGSRFVLAPGLGVDFRLPTVAGANAHGFDNEVANCVAGVIGAIEFPAPKGGGGVQVNYPLTFHAAGQ